jgi:hypothetical protein
VNLLKEDAGQTNGTSRDRATPRLPRQGLLKKIKRYGIAREMTAREESMP